LPGDGAGVVRPSVVWTLPCLVVAVAACAEGVAVLRLLRRFDRQPANYRLQPPASGAMMSRRS
jgi:hypothetical protein